MLSVIMFNVTYKPFVLCVIMLSVIRLNVVMLSVVAPSIWGVYIQKTSKSNFFRNFSRNINFGKFGIHQTS